MTGPALGKLVPCGGGRTIPLLQEKLIIGRDATCDVVLAVGGVSGRHCQLEWAEGGWFVRDLGSRNGIRVDGVRCEAQRLKSGSILWVGGLRYEIIYAGQSAGTRPQAKPLFGQGLLEKAGLVRGQKIAGEEEAPSQRHNLEDED